MKLTKFSKNWMTIINEIVKEEEEGKKEKLKKYPFLEEL